MFEVQSYKKRFDANKVCVKENGVFPYVVRMSSNNGQKGYIEEDKKFLNEGNTISFGQDTATMFYQEAPYFTGDKIKILKAKNKRFKKNNALFFLTAIMKPFGSFSWGCSSFSSDIIKSQKIILPTKNGKIDFDFMESFIAELEAQRIAELEAYLSVTGLKNYELTEKECKALDRFEKLELGEYRLGALFEIKGNPQLNKDSFVFNENGEFPYFTRTVCNNGFAGYVDYLDEEHKISGDCLAVGMIGMQFFYMQKDFYAGQFTKRAIPKNFSLTQRTALYFISLLNKKQQGFQNVLVRDFKKEFNKAKILLPVKNGKIDFDFMETFISAIQKLVIKDVVLYADRKFAATKDILLN